MSHEQRIAAARRSLGGLSVGDAFGESFFGISSNPSVLELHLSTRTPPNVRWRWTDDTAMTAVLVDVLDRHHAVDQDALAGAFARRYAEDDRRGYGGTAHRRSHRAKRHASRRLGPTTRAAAATDRTLSPARGGAPRRRAGHRETGGGVGQPNGSNHIAIEVRLPAGDHIDHGQPDPALQVRGTLCNEGATGFLSILIPGADPFDCGHEGGPGFAAVHQHFDRVAGQTNSTRPELAEQSGDSRRLGSSWAARGAASGG